MRQESWVAEWERRSFSGPCECRLPRLRDGERAVKRMDESCVRCGKLSVVSIERVEFGASAEEAVAEMRHRVEQRTGGLTCSAGIAANGLLAKICSDRNKPNGQFCLPRTKEAIQEFLHSLPIRKVSGIGGVSEAILKGAYGIEKVGDILPNCGRLFLLSSSSHFHHLASIALGIGSNSFAT